MRSLGALGGWRPGTLRIWRRSLLAWALVLALVATVTEPVPGARFVAQAAPAATLTTATIVPYLDSDYRYSVVAQGAGTGFEQPAFDDSSFALGSAAFGTVGSSCALNSEVRTSWAVNTDILVRRHFSLPVGASNLRVGVAIDNDVQVFLNGTDISGGLQPHDGCPVRDSFVFSASDALLLSGDNVLAVRGRDRGQSAFLDVQVLADVPSDGSVVPHTLGTTCLCPFSHEPVNLGTGNYTAAAHDLVLPGRLLGLSFVRTYNSSDPSAGPLGPGWTHSYQWSLRDAGGAVEVRRGDGRRDTFLRQTDGSYRTPADLHDTLAKNGDNSFTVTLTNQVRYEFSSAGVLTRMHEPAGNQITLAHTGGNLTALTDAVGRQVTLAYDGANRLTQLQDPLGRKVSYAYDASGRLATVTDKIGNAAGQDPALHQWRYAYDGTTQHLTTITDPDGRVRATNTYDAQGRVSEQRDALGRLTTMVYGAGQTVLTDPRSHATTYTSDGRMRVLGQSDVVGANTYAISYTYDAAGNRTSVTDRNGKRTDFTYDARGNLLTKTDPAPDGVSPRPLTEFAYDALNNLTQITDALGFVATLGYDPATNALLSVSRQVDASTSVLTKYEYGDPANPGLPTKVIAPRGNTGPTPDYAFATTLSYDAQANLTTRIDPDGAKTTFAYDAAGRLASLVDPDGYATGANPAEHTWTIASDENDRETRRADPLGNALASGYDGAGNRTSLTDRRGNVTSYAYDANTRLASVAQKPDPAGQPTLVYTTQVTRDENGNATRITQANGVATDYGFDALDRLTAVTTHPDAQTNLVTSYVLDGNGQPTSRTTGDGVTVSYVYDALSRLTSVAAPGLTTITYAYDPLGRRTQMTDGTGSTTYQYDGLGRLTSVAAPNGTLSYAYDRDGNRTTLGYPGGQNVTYAYSPGGRLNTVTDWASRVSSYLYQASGVVSRLDYPNGLRATYSYDRAQRLTRITNAVGASSITDHAYTLDPEGNRTALDEFVQGITPPELVWSGSVQVNDVTSGQQDRPAVALGADGATYLVWDDYRAGSHGDIFFSRRDPATGAWSANQKVNDDTTTRTQWRPALALDGANNAYALWQDDRDGSKSPNTNIYFAKRSAGTGTWGANVKVNDDRQGSPAQTEPRIAVTSAGAAVAAWVDFRANQWNVFSSRLPAGSATWAANLRVSDNTSSRKYTPDVAVAADGTAHAVWEDDRSGNADVWFATLPTGASAWSANQKISDDPGTAAQYAPRIGIDDAGNLLVVFLDDRVPSTQVRMTRLLAGTSSWEASRVVSDAAAVPVSLALGVRSDGDAVAAWQDARGASYDVWGADYSFSTNSWSTPTLLSDDPGSTAQMRPTVALNASEVALAWRDDRVTGGDIRARRRTPVPGTDRFTYSYDGLNRLLSVAGPIAESFTYDGATNVATRTGPSASYTYDSSNRMIGDGSRSFVWTPADRLAGRGADTFTYDPAGRLTNSTVAGAARSYSYDGDGTMRSRSDSAGSTAQVYDPSILPTRLSVDGAVRFVYGLSVLYVDGTDGIRALATDGLGGVRAEVGANGTVQSAVRFAAYGARSASYGTSSQSLGFAGQLETPDGLIYLRARWYDPSVGRFLSSHPIRGSVAVPYTLNAYQYVSGNPVNATDASGLCSDPSPGAPDPRYCIAAFIPEQAACLPWRATSVTIAGPWRTAGPLVSSCTLARTDQLQERSLA